MSFAKVFKSTRPAIMIKTDIVIRVQKYGFSFITVYTTLYLQPFLWNLTHHTPISNLQRGNDQKLFCFVKKGMKSTKFYSLRQLTSHTSIKKLEIAVASAMYCNQLKIKQTY